MKFSKPVHRLKSDAKALARGRSIALNQAQDIIAWSEGFLSWSHMIAKWNQGQRSPWARFVESERDELRRQERISWPDTFFKGGEKPCPFCGAGSDYLSIDAANEDAFEQCDNCGATGPHALSEGEAYRAWDIRSRNSSIDACPFCGEVAKPAGSRDEVHCVTCGASGPRIDLVEDDEDFPKKDAVSLWRTRSSTPR